MKKLLILALATQLAAAQTVKEDAKDVGAQLAEIVTVPVKAVKNAAIKVIKSDEVDDIKNVFQQIGSFPVEQAEEITATTKEIVEDIANSDAWDDTKSVFVQIAAFPVEQFQEAQELGKKIADSKFVAKVKKGTRKVINKTKDAAHTVKDTAVEVGNSIKDATVEAGTAVKNVSTKVGTAVKDAFIEADIIDDAKSVGQQFAEPAVVFWAGVVSFVKTVKAEIVD